MIAPHCVYKNIYYEFYAFSGPVAAYENCWIFGDAFTSRSFEQFFQSRKCTEYNAYRKAHFDVFGYFNSFASENPSIVGRFASLLSNAVKSRNDKKLQPLPKIIVVVVDDNLLTILHDHPLGVSTASDMSKAYSRIINFVMMEYERAVASFKENLPAKCVKNGGFPSFL